MEEDEIGEEEPIYDVINDSNEKKLKRTVTGAAARRGTFNRARAWSTESTGDRSKLLIRLREKFHLKPSEELPRNESLSPTTSAGFPNSKAVADKRRALRAVNPKTRRSPSWHEASVSEVESKRSRSKSLSSGFFRRFRDSKREDILPNSDRCKQESSCWFPEELGDPHGGLQNGALLPGQETSDPHPIPARQRPTGSEKLKKRAQSISFPLDRDSLSGKEVNFQENTAQQCRNELPSLSEDLERLSHLSWYWGPLSRYEAEKILAGKSNGTFLVRDSFHEFHLFSVTFRSKGRTLHTRIAYDKGWFGFMGPGGVETKTNSVVDLMEKTMKISQRRNLTHTTGGLIGPSYPIRFLFPFSRFEEVPSLQHLCRFVIRQNSRCDKLHELPIPAKLIRYLRVENHYLPEGETEN